jgi:hypothetical protein
MWFSPEDELTAALDNAERQTLMELLQRVADQQGLEPGVHPGYSSRVEATRPARRARLPHDRIPQAQGPGIASDHAR